MDKQEYKIRAEEIRALVDEKNYREAADIADTIDWRRVKSVKMLCMVSDIYKMVRRYEDSKTILEMAYDKRPGSRMIIYALTELCLKLGDIVNAWEYYKEFCQIAADDSRRYILLYKVYAAQEVSLEEQIKVLEKLKEEEYIDRWAFELAYLYHKIGFGTKCVEECDEMILWFGEGRYVRKAMELKMLHEPLTPRQQAVYNGEKQQEIELGDTQVIPNLEEAIVKENEGKDVSTDPTIKLPVEEVADIQVKIMDDSPYNTINLQKVLAEDVVELMAGEKKEPVWEGIDQVVPDGQSEEAADSSAGQNVVPFERAEAPFDGEEEETIDNTEEILLPDDAEEEEEDSENARIIGLLMAPMLQETQEIPPIPKEEEVFFEDPNTVDLAGVAKKVDAAAVSAIEEPEDLADENDPKASIRKEEQSAEEEKPRGPVYEEASTRSGVKKVIVPTSPEQGVLRAPREAMNPTDFATHKSGFDEILSQESDGQISLVVPEKEKVEKQITGQMSIRDILQEWEQVKRDREAQLKNDVKKRVQDQTGELFAEFEASKDKLVNELEAAAKEAIEKEAERAAELEAEEAALSEGEIIETEEGEYFPEEHETEIAAAEEEALASDGESISEADGQNADEKAAAPEKADVVETAEKADKGASENNLPEELRPAVNDRPLTPEEKELFEPFVHSRKSREQLFHVLDNMSLAAYTGNVLVTGEEAAGAMNFARNLVRDMQLSDRNFSGKAAKISGKALNKKKPEEIVTKLTNGALIIVEAGGMNCSTAESLVKALQTENKGILVLLVDTKGAIDSLLNVNTVLRDPFNTRIDIEALGDDALVEYGRKFAYEREYSIDEMGGLALHTRIADMQTAEHSVTVADVRGLVKEAIRHANKKTPKHFFDVLLGKRYDKEDMIVLREEDFFYYA